MKKLIEKIWAEVLGSLKSPDSDRGNRDYKRKKSKREMSKSNVGMNRENDLLEKLVDIPENRLLKAALTAVTVTGKAVLNRPGIKATLNAAKSKIVTGKGEQYQVVEEAKEQADRIALVLQKKGIKADKLGVDGLPGCGKSTLARALAKRLDMKWKSLDHENLDVSMGFSDKLTVYEHHRLYRTQNVDVFDAIIYIDQTIETTKANIIRRTQSGRGALIHDVLDFEKLKKIGKLAFEVCAGEPIHLPDSNLIIKVRGTAGYGARENLMKQLKLKGEESTDLKKEEMLFLLAYGKRQHGLMSYFLPSAFNDELFKGLLAGLRKINDD